MERLTKRLGEHLVFPDELVGVTLTPDNAAMVNILQRLAAYEDTGFDPERIAELAQAEAGGRLIVLPCRAGDTLWTFCTHPNSKVYSFSVTDTSTLNGTTMLNTDRLGVIPAFDVGKTVFLTRAEAEAQLERRIGGAR